MPSNLPDQSPDAGMVPMVEKFAGVNLPYRGLIDHGVAPIAEETPDEAHRYSGRDVVYEEVEPEPEPIAVRIVRADHGKEIRAFSTSQYVLMDSRPIQIVGRNAQRTAVTLKVLTGATGSIVIGPDSGVTTFSGYPLATGEVPYTCSCTEPIFAMLADPTKVATIAVVQEYTEEYQ